MKTKKYAEKSADISVLVISREVSLKIFSKNELKNILTEFHDFIINLKYLALIDLTKTFTLNNDKSNTNYIIVKYFRESLPWLIFDHPLKIQRI